MSDTPQTDAETHDLSDYGPPVPCSGGDWVAADYARKLERARDEARADVRTLQDIKRKHEHDELVAAQENDRLKRERDEARKEIDDIRKMLSESGEAIGNGVHDFSIIEMVENIIQSKNYFIKKSDSAEWERDEARRHLKEIEEYGTEEINAAVEIRQKLAHALVALDNMQERERDEARGYALKLKRERDEAREDLIKSYTKIKDLESEIRGVAILRDEAREDAAQLADRLSGLELRTTEELARLELQLALWEDGNLISEETLGEIRLLNEQINGAFRERDAAHKIAERAINDLAWFNETNAQSLRAELNQLKEGGK